MPELLRFSRVFSSESSCSSFSVISQQFALFGGWARIFRMPALSGSYGVDVKRMKSAQRIEGVYSVMMGSASIGLIAPRSALKPRASGTWCIRRMHKPRLTIFRVVAHSCAAPAAPWSSMSELYYMRPTFPRFVSTALPASPFLAVQAETGRLSSNMLQRLGAPS